MNLGNSLAEKVKTIFGLLGLTGDRSPPPGTKIIKNNPFSTRNNAVPPPKSEAEWLLIEAERCNLAKKEIS